MRVNKEDMDMTQEEWRSVFDAFVTELADKDKLIDELRGEQDRVNSNKEWLKNSPTPEVGEWVGWNGGPCPVHPDTVVQTCHLATGSPTTNSYHGRARHQVWDNIIAYRIITPYVEPKKAREFWLWAENKRPMFVMDKPDKRFPRAIRVREVLDDE